MDKLSAIDYIYNRLDNSLKLSNNSNINDKRNKALNVLFSNLLPHQSKYFIKINVFRIYDF